MHQKSDLIKQMTSLLIGKEMIKMACIEQAPNFRCIKSEFIKTWCFMDFIFPNHCVHKQWNIGKKHFRGFYFLNLNTLGDFMHLHVCSNTCTSIQWVVTCRFWYPSLLATTLLYDKLDLYSVHTIWYILYKRHIRIFELMKLIKFFHLLAEK